MSALTMQIGAMRDSGMSYKDIEQALGVSERTVKRHLDTYREVKKYGTSPEVEAKADLAKSIADSAYKHLKAKYDSLVKRVSLEDRLAQVARDCVKAFQAPPPQPLYIYAHPEKMDTEEATLVLGDWHGGDKISPVETLGIGGYDLCIMARRVEFLVEKFISIVKMHRGNAKITKALILCLGDFVSGWIHKELEKYADATIMEQVYLVGYVLAQAILEVSQHFEEVEVVCVPGNHGRFTEKVEHKGYYENWDTFVYQIAAMFLRNVKNVKFVIPKSRVQVVDINGHRYCVTHGDMGKGNPKHKSLLFNDLLSYKGEDVDGYFFGHFHAPDIIETLHGPVIVNGTLAGATEFSVGKMGLAVRPMQFIAGIHEHQGVSWRYPIWLDDIPSPTKPLRYSLDSPDVWAEAPLFGPKGTE